MKGNAGFGAHPHRDAEIFSYVIDGKLSHKDNMGNKVMSYPGHWRSLFCCRRSHGLPVLRS